MSKKLWLRLVGLLALFGWGATAILFWANTMAPDATTKANVDILMFASVAWTGLTTLLWTVLSLAEALDHPALTATKKSHARIP